MRYRICSVAALCTLLLASLPSKAEEKPVVDFGRDILPLMKASCFKCHDAKKNRSGLRLDSREQAMRGGESGKVAIIPKVPDKSELIARITNTDEETGMPPGKEKLSPELQPQA